MKRLVTIQDISCFGRCSQTVALPIISALGIETVVLPTAILSTHTGEFMNYSFLSLYEEMPKITEHWRKEGISFDAIYIGYIGKSELFLQVYDFIDEFSNNNTVVYVDPAMADNGKLYSGLDSDYVNAVKKLCKKANIISPNSYEAMFLTDESCEANININQAENAIKELTELCSKVIITGIHQNDNMLTLGYDKKVGELIKKENKRIDGMFYGTGDIFSSAFIGTYLDGLSFNKAISFADDFVQLCINATADERKKYWYGINFEKCLYYLTDFYKNCHKNDTLI